MGDIVQQVDSCSLHTCSSLSTLIAPQNLYNDMEASYLFAADAFSAVPWRGGVNLTALQMVEQRAYGW